MASLQIEESQLTGANGKVVIVTGGASGIGAAAARLFHSLGAKVVVGDVDEQLGNNLAAELGSNLVFQRCDVTKWSQLYSLFETADSSFGRIDVVLANAGVPEIEEIFEDKVDKDTGRLLEPKYVVLDIDLKAVFSTVKLAKHFFENQKTPGSIVITSSTAGIAGDMYNPAYTASKHGILGMMRSLCGKAETPFTRANIRVNCVAPFMTESGFITNDLRGELHKVQLPINEAHTVATAMVYLAVTEGLYGKTIYIADNEFTEIEESIRTLRPQWLGEKNDRLLSPLNNSSLLQSAEEEGTGREQHNCKRKVYSM